MTTNELEIVVTSTDKTSFDKMKAEAKTAGSAAGDNLGKGIEKGGEEGGKKAGKAIGKGIAAGAAAAGAAAGALLAKGLSDNLEIGAANSKLKAQLGLSKEDAAEAGEVAGAVYRDNWGGSIDEVNEAIRSVSTTLGGVAETSKADLQGMTVKALALSETFGVDVAESTNAVSKLIKNGLAKDANEAFDIITNGMQGGVNKSGDFLETLNEYAPQFDKLGMSGGGVLATLQAGLQAGARDTDVIADAFKEFSIRAIDGSTSTADAYKSLGMDADKMAQSIAKGGPSAAKATSETLDALAKIKDPVERNRVGVELFGTQWEDTVQQILPALASVDVMQDTVTGSTDKMAAAVGDNAKAKIEGAKRAFEGWTQSMASADGPLGDVVTNTLAFGAPALAMAGQIGMMVTGLAALNAGLLLAKIRTVATTVATGAATAAQWLFNTAMSANPIALVIIAIAAIAAGLIYAYKHSEKFRAIVNAVGKAAARAFGWVVDKLKDVWNWIKSKWPLLKAILMGPIGAAVSWIVKHWDQIKEGARKAVDGIKSGFAGAFHAIIDPIDRAFRWAMGKLSAIKDTIGNVVSKIPGFAHGGIVGAASGGPRSGMTWVGENGPELVKLPAGSHVRSHGDSMRDSGGSGVIRVILELVSSGSPIDDWMVEVLRKAIRVKGGDVQAVLGRG